MIESTFLVKPSIFSFYFSDEFNGYVSLTLTPTDTLAIHYLCRYVINLCKLLTRKT